MGLASPADSGDNMRTFITRKGGVLYEGAVPFRFMGLDAPNLFQNESQLLPNLSNRFPDEFELRDSLDTLRQMGARATRTFTLSIYSDRDKLPAFILGLGSEETKAYNQEAFQALDRLLALCHEYDVRLIVPFLASQSFRGWRGFDEFAAFRGKEGIQFFRDPQVKQDFKDLIRYVLNRKNTVSGLVYKDDPAILAWQVANEPTVYFPERGKPNDDKLVTDWTLEMAAYLKSVDANHLVAAAGGDAERYIASPDVDVLSVHYYQYWDKLGGGDGDIAAMLLRDAARFNGRKPLFADEFGLADTQTLARFIGVLFNSEVSGGLLWGMRPHRRDGGFYYHNEPGSGVNSYHWPGFANGAAYDEQMVLRLLRESAFKIRGLAIPDLPPPTPAPVLLPVSPTGELRWRGSTGAAGYDIERSRSKDGPWTVVAADVSDEVVPAADVAGFEAQWDDAPVWAPPALWKDSPDRTKGPYYYRVVGKNAAGRTAYSNVVGLK